MLQVALALLRFGDLPKGGSLGNILIGLAQFFAAGAMAYILVRGLLGLCSPRWRRAMILAAAIATPIALIGSLAGGLLGPGGVLAFALLPYLALVGLPVSILKVWLRTVRRDRQGPVPH